MAADSGSSPLYKDAQDRSIRPVVAISMGDPVGIGPEVVCKALGESGLRRRASYRIYGSAAALRRAADRAGIAPFWREEHCGGAGEVVLIDRHASLERPTAGTETPRPTDWGGELSFRWVEEAIADARGAGGHERRADAIVTAPISKTSWNLAGHTRWPGHTELLSERFVAARSGMLFVGPHLCVMLATIHVPLMRVGELLTTSRVLEAIELAHEACLAMGLRPDGAAAPRIAVCGLNPHAGEAGILGSEDAAVIAPAVAAARGRGIHAIGPLPGDTVFNAAARPPVGKGLYDCVVAMYHDQGLIPVKLVDREETVNVTVGLPTVRTSPAHGTAFDIAGKNMASAASMRAAIELAIRMAMRRTAE